MPSANLELKFTWKSLKIAYRDKEYTLCLNYSIQKCLLQSYWSLLAKSSICEISNHFYCYHRQRNFTVPTDGPKIRQNNAANWSHCAFSRVNFFKNQTSKYPKLSKWQFLTFWNQLKFISRKIRVARKWLINNYPQSRFPIRLPRSVVLSKSSIHITYISELKYL